MLLDCNLHFYPQGWRQPEQIDYSQVVERVVSEKTLTRKKTSSSNAVSGGTNLKTRPCNNT
ncbi:MAG: hypothetical protein K8R90_08130 [Candidatus Cloacimonetes bacterium]|nr:hypothetical protein [Candidatus Cloacimonadota bacterium]